MKIVHQDWHTCIWRRRKALRWLDFIKRDIKAADENWRTADIDRRQWACTRRNKKNAPTSQVEIARGASQRGRRRQGLARLYQTHRSGRRRASGPQCSVVLAQLGHLLRPLELERRPERIAAVSRQAYENRT